MGRVNRNADYIYVVDGETVWERLRAIRNFLEEREIALEMAEMGQETFDATTDAGKETTDYRIASIKQRQTLRLIDSCREEVAFLQELEKRLTKEAEESRVPGKTDREMYEINYFNEMKIRLIKEVQSELMASGYVTPTTMKALLRNPAVLEECVKLKLMKSEGLELANLFIPALTFDDPQMGIQAPEE